MSLICIDTSLRAARPPALPRLPGHLELFAPLVAALLGGLAACGMSAPDVAAPEGAAPDATLVIPDETRGGLSIPSDPRGGLSIPSDPRGEPSVELAFSDPFGIHLVDGRGRTLYYGARDRPAPGGAAAATCTGRCAALWPPFHTDTIGTNLYPADFAEITRVDGRRQTTYKGWPLYYYADEHGVGSFSGDDFDHVWFAIPWPDYSVIVMSAIDGDVVRLYLADPAGDTLYYSTNDTVATGTAQAKSACTGDCERTWPPYFAENNVMLPSALDISQYGLMMRPDGSWQSTWAGHPLYRYAGDAAPGQTKGDRVDDAWFVVRPQVN